MSIAVLLKAFFAPANILSFIGKTFQFVIVHWKEVAVACMLFTIFHQNFMQLELLKWFGVRTIPGITQEYEEKLGVKSEQLAECELGRAELKGEIDALNTQVDKWASVSSQLQTQHDELVAELSEMRKKSEQAVQDILAGPTPESCEAAIKYLKDSAGELKWKK